MTKEKADRLIKRLLDEIIEALEDEEVGIAEILYALKVINIIVEKTRAEVAGEITKETINRGMN